MISRVAESCFWLSRYLERAETLARLLDVNLAFVLDVNLPRTEQWRPMIVVTGEEARFGEIQGADAASNAEVVQSYLTWERECPSSIRSSLYWARENARTVRETISLEMWETVNDLWLFLNSRGARKLFDRDRHAFYAHVRDACVLFHGVCHNTMLHEEPFDFMRLATGLERAGQTARILDVKYHRLGPTRSGPETSAESAQWLAILRSCSGIEPFLKRSGNTLTGLNVAAFLLYEPAFPRSVVHNLDRAANFLDRIRDASEQAGSSSHAALEKLRRHVASSKTADVVKAGIHDELTLIIDSTADVCSLVHDDFFDPSPEINATIAGETNQ